MVEIYFRSELLVELVPNLSNNTLFDLLFVKQLEAIFFVHILTVHLVLNQSVFILDLRSLMVTVHS